MFSVKPNFAINSLAGALSPKVFMPITVSVRLIKPCQESGCRALHPDSWQGLINLTDTVIGMNTFGESAPASELMAKFGFTENNIITEAKKLLLK